MMVDDSEQLGLATEVTVAWLSNPHTRAGAEDVSTMLGSVLSAIRGLETPPESEGTPATESAAEYTPAVTKRKSLASPDYILSMIDGTKHRSLKRHLRNHGLTPDEYRQRYGLKADYPMVARSYSEARRATAKQHQFGRKPAGEASSDPQPEAASEPPEKPAAEPAPEASPAPSKRRRLGISGAKQAAQAHLGSSEVTREGGEEAQPTSTEE